MIHDSLKKAVSQDKDLGSLPSLQDDLYLMNARDYAEISEFWARRSQRFANSIDLPAAMSIAIAINLLITCLALTIYQGFNHA